VGWKGVNNVRPDVTIFCWGMVGSCSWGFGVQARRETKWAEEGRIKQDSSIGAKIPIIETLPTLRLLRLLDVSVHHPAAVGLDPASDAADHHEGLQVATDLLHIVLQPRSAARASAKR